MLMQFYSFNMHRCSSGILARQCVLYYSQQLLSMEIKSIYVVSKPATVVQNGDLDPCVFLGWRNNSFSSLNKRCLYCHCNVDEQVRQLCSVQHITAIIQKGYCGKQQMTYDFAKKPINKKMLLYSLLQFSQTRKDIEFLSRRISRAFLNVQPRPSS